MQHKVKKKKKMKKEAPGCLKLLGGVGVIICKWNRTAWMVFHLLTGTCSNTPTHHSPRWLFKCNTSFIPTTCLEKQVWVDFPGPTKTNAVLCSSFFLQKHQEKGPKGSEHTFVIETKWSHRTVGTLLRSEFLTETLKSRDPDQWMSPFQHNTWKGWVAEFLHWFPSMHWTHHRLHIQHIAAC